jgi:hypothetical protein
MRIRIIESSSAYQLLRDLRSCKIKEYTISTMPWKDTDLIADPTSIELLALKRGRGL